MATSTTCRPARCCWTARRPSPLIRSRCATAADRAVPVYRREQPDVSLEGLFGVAAGRTRLDVGPDQFRVADLQPGQVRRVEVAGQAVAVCNVAGHFYAVQDACTHADGPLSEGQLDGQHIICPWHASRFDVLTGAVLDGPASEPVRTYRVVIEGDLGRVEPGPA